MNTIERVNDVFKRAVDMYKQGEKELRSHIEGPPPGGRELRSGPLHAKWFTETVTAMERKYPPQMYITPDGPVFGSLWLLTRPYVKGWDAELRKYERETGMREVGDGSTG